MDIKSKVQRRKRTSAYLMSLPVITDLNLDTSLSSLIAYNTAYFICHEEGTSVGKPKRSFTHLLKPKIHSLQSHEFGGLYWSQSLQISESVKTSHLKSMVSRPIRHTRSYSAAGMSTERTHFFSRTAPF